MIKYYGMSLTLVSVLSLYSAEDSPTFKLIKTIPNQSRYFCWNASNEIVTSNKKIRDNAQLEQVISDGHHERWIRTDIKAYKRSGKLPADADTVLTDGWQVMEHAQPNRSRHYLRPDGKQFITVDIEESWSDDPSLPFIEKVQVHDVETNQIIKIFETRTSNTFDWPLEQSFKFDWSPDSSKLAIVDTSHPWDYKNNCEKIGPETITIYQPDDFSERIKLTVPEGGIDEIAFSQQSNWLAAHCNNIWGNKKKVLIWNTVTGYLAAKLVSRHYGLRTPAIAEQKAVLEHTWSPDGKSIALFNPKNDIEIYQLPQD